MAKGKSTKGQTTIYKTLHIKTGGELRIFFRHPIYLTCRTEHEPVCIFQPRSALHPAELERPHPRFFMYFFYNQQSSCHLLFSVFLPGMSSL